MISQTNIWPERRMDDIVAHLPQTNSWRMLTLSIVKIIKEVFDNYG